jgi:hypothetical protein
MKEATPEDIAKVRKQLAETCNDPDLTFLECHCFDLRWYDGLDRRDCKNCSVYIKFAKEYPNHCPNYEKEEQK